MKFSIFNFRHNLRVLLLASFVLCFACAAFAQQTDGTITGEIKDARGAALVGVEVTARHLETGFTRTAMSENEGRFVFPGMPVGTYEIRSAQAGFRPFVQERLRLAIGEAAMLNITLEVASIDTQVEVTGNAELVNTQTSELSYLVNENAIRELPLNGRNYTDLAFLQPGVIAYPHRDGGSVVAHGLGASINGQDPRSNVYLIDGTPQNDFTNGPAGSAAGTVLGVEGIREFRVETNAYSAEFGRNSGGQINAVSKSGSNEYHGSLYEF
ncbi:MAG: carboxypeptidase regulatory-like domain-containing protein, partial [Acidobacteria bacterium]|nr:carboxypeptidase regulatory-like domain-containing protein [Acidobacteriota bacterium]